MSERRHWGKVGFKLPTQCSSRAGKYYEGKIYIMRDAGFYYEGNIALTKHPTKNPNTLVGPNLQKVAHVL